MKDKMIDICSYGYDRASLEKDFQSKRKFSPSKSSLGAARLPDDAILVYELGNRERSIEFYNSDMIVLGKETRWPLRLLQEAIYACYHIDIWDNDMGIYL